jgi:transmembrane sensor
MKTLDDDSPDAGRRRGRNANAPGRSALDWAREAGEVEGVLRDLDVYLLRRRRRRLRAASSSCVMLLLLGAGMMWRSQSRLETVAAPLASSVVVSTPGIRTLDDGSIVELKSGAEIVVNLSDNLRRVTLQQGEAHFQVARDPQRPFVVSAAGVAVRAVGTAFSVQLGFTAVDIVVTEGTVAIDQPVAEAATGEAAPPSVHGGAERVVEGTSIGRVGDAPLAIVEAGRRVVVALSREAAETAGPVVQRVSAEELEQRLAWRIARLEFTDTPLAEAIRMFNQHAAGQRTSRLVLGDPSLGKLQLSGVLRADNIEALQRLLEREFGIYSVQRGDEIVFQRPR